MGRSPSLLSPLNGRIHVMRPKKPRPHRLQQSGCLMSLGKIVPMRTASAKSRVERRKAASKQEYLPGVKEQEWLRDHWREYVGLWVAVEGNQLVGKADNAREALETARSSGHSSAFLVHVTEPSELPFGGW
jgi:hypothetical protein